MKGIGVLLEMGLITLEPSSYFDKHGLKWKGNNLYTILSVGVAMDAFYERQLRELEISVIRQKAEAHRVRGRELTLFRRIRRNGKAIDADVSKDPSKPLR